MRVTIAKSHRPGGGKSFKGGNVGVPQRLNPLDLNWAQSRPLEPWSIGPMPGQHYFWDGWEVRPIELIELYTSDVERLFGTASVSEGGQDETLLG